MRIFPRVFRVQALDVRQDHEQVGIDQVRHHAGKAVVIAEPEPENTSEEALFANARRRNGLILVPTKNPERPVTVELVKELSED